MSQPHPYPLVIRPCFGPFIESHELSGYIQAMGHVLKKLIPESVLFEDETDLSTWIGEHLPLVKWTEALSLPNCISIYLLCHPCKGTPTEAFFRHMLMRGLIPERNPSLISFQYLEFYLIGEEKLFLAEAKLLIETHQDYQRVQQIMPLFAKEIQFGISSPKYAIDILDNKPLQYDQNIGLIHEKVIEKIRKHPHLFDEGIFEEMGQFLTLSDKEFRRHRSVYHLAELVSAQYQTKKSLAKALRFVPDRRHLFVRFLPTHLHFPFGHKPVLGLMISLNLHDMQEFFREKHITQAVQKFIPDVQRVKGSFYFQQKPQEMTQLIYLELEKEGGKKITLEELRRLRKELPEELKKKIEKLVSSLFIVRNEEEIMKNMVTLAQELRSPSDLPQMIVHFDEQTPHELIFSVVLVRAVNESSSKLLSSLGDQTRSFLVERYQILGKLDETHLKEACVLRFHISKTPDFFRTDFSINLHLARQKVMTLINELFGRVRDYTGGLISEQEKNYLELRLLFQELSENEDQLLEDFFYSLTPTESRCALPIASLKLLFSEFLVATKADLPDNLSYYLKIIEEDSQVFVILRADTSIQQAIQPLLTKFSSSITLAFSQVIFQESLALSFLYLSHEKSAQQEFLNAVKEAIEIWQNKWRSQKIFRITSHDLRTILDPRLGGGYTEFSVILKMLYEGLTRIDSEGKPQPSIAQSIKISDDQMRYQFRLRDSFWSDGSPLIAYDFEHAWKKILHPSFKSPFSSLLYPIKNAKAVKENAVSMDQLGVHALNEKTLLVELEFPTPSFLELTANALYSPVHHKIDQIHPDWASQSGEAYICNGPFTLGKRISEKYELKQNQHYWNKECVHFDEVMIYKTDPYEALDMFMDGKIDWLGRPLRPWEPFFSKSLPHYCTRSAATIHWCVFNVDCFPLNHFKVRQALGLALCRQEIVQALAGDLTPADTPLPQEHSQRSGMTNYEESSAKARHFFGEALLELNIKKEQFPILTFICLKGNIRETTALILKKQWEEVLGIHCRVEACDWNTLFDKMTRGDYQIGSMTWQALINDPLYTLNAFRYRDELINYPKWENPHYQTLLDRAQREKDPEKRNSYFSQAEALLIQELPLVPIYYEPEKFIKRNNLEIPLSTAPIDFMYLKIKEAQYAK